MGKYRSLGIMWLSGFIISLMQVYFNWIKEVEEFIGTYNHNHR